MLPPCGRALHDKMLNQSLSQERQQVDLDDAQFGALCVNLDKRDRPLTANDVREAHLESIGEKN
eukprot:scaffold76169_cov118-Phaeocystis_antarctica.AAC.1